MASRSEKNGGSRQTICKRFWKRAQISRRVSRALSPKRSGHKGTLGYDHGVTKALARAAQTMGKVALWKTRLALKTLRRDQREAIAAAFED